MITPLTDEEIPFNPLGTLIIHDPAYEDNLFDPVCQRVRRFIEGTGCKLCGSIVQEYVHRCEPFHVRTLCNHLCRGNILFRRTNETGNEIGLRLDDISELLSTPFVKKYVSMSSIK